MAENLDEQRTPKPRRQERDRPQPEPLLQGRPQNEQNLSQQKQIEDLKNRALARRAAQRDADER